MLLWVLEAKYRGTELKILEIGDSCPCTAEDDAGSIQAILHMSSLSGKQELRDSTEVTVAGVKIFLFATQ
jgi:hypothetical protein